MSIDAVAVCVAATIALIRGFDSAEATLIVSIIWITLAFVGMMNHGFGTFDAHSAINTVDEHQDTLTKLRGELRDAELLMLDNAREVAITHRMNETIRFGVKSMFFSAGVLSLMIITPDDNPVRWVIRILLVLGMIALDLQTFLERRRRERLQARMLAVVNAIPARRSTDTDDYGLQHRDEVHHA